MTCRGSDLSNADSGMATTTRDATEVKRIEQIGIARAAFRAVLAIVSLRYSATCCGATLMEQDSMLHR
jgi:hypothetical protein